MTKKKGKRKNPKRVAAGKKAYRTRVRNAKAKNKKLGPEKKPSKTLRTDRKHTIRTQRRKDGPIKEVKAKPKQPTRSGMSRDRKRTSRTKRTGHSADDKRFSHVGDRRAAKQYDRW